MRKSYLTYGIILVVFTGAILLLEYNKPKKINWYPSFVTHHKIPYGTKVFNDQLQRIYGSNVVPVTKPPYEVLKKDSSMQGTYLFVNNSITWDESELEQLLKWTGKGNTLFVATSLLNTTIKHELNIETSFTYSNAITPKFQYQFVNPNLHPKQPYIFEKDFSAPYFTELDSSKTSIIGKLTTEQDTLNEAFKPVTIKMHYKKGTIIVSLFPKGFTNYFILKDPINRQYVANMLSYLPQEEPIYVDNYYKSGKAFYSSLMHIVLNAKSLRWGYYLALIGAVLYVVFEGKRKQRAIPVVTPLKNQTLAFTRTIANMYYERGAQKEITSHKIASFLEYIRSRFHVNTTEINDTFYFQLAARSNHTETEIKELWKFLRLLSEKTTISEALFIQLNSRIELFKNKAHGTK